jgi:NADH dehydrogenase/NADH:ubiquinone oxidoreductase subunit G
MGWKDALRALLDRAGALEARGVKAVASPYASNEDLGAFAALVKELGGGEIVYRSAMADDEVPLKGFPQLARRRELAPNGKGVELVGGKRVGGPDGRGGLESVAGHDGVVLVLGDPLADQGADFGASAALYVYLGARGGTATEAAHIVLPVTTFAEQEGTFTNLHGRVQRFWPALEGPGAARPAWLVVGALLSELAGDAAPRSAADSFARLGERFAAFAGLSYDDLGSRGAVVNETVSLTGD